jgi:hypothetical protein
LEVSLNFLSSADVMIVISVVLLIFGFAEIRQYIVETPARIAEAPPVVVILVLTADIDQAIDRTGPAEHLAARLRDAPVAAGRLRLAGVEPVHFRVCKKLAVAKRNMDPWIAIFSSGLQKKNTVAPRLRKPVSEYATCAACSDDDKVERVRVFHFVLWSSCQAATGYRIS